MGQALYLSPHCERRHRPVSRCPAPPDFQSRLSPEIRRSIDLRRHRSTGNHSPADYAEPIVLVRDLDPGEPTVDGGHAHVRSPESGTNSSPWSAAPLSSGLDRPASSRRAGATRHRGCTGRPVGPRLDQASRRVSRAGTIRVVLTRKNKARMGNPLSASMWRFRRGFWTCSRATGERSARRSGTRQRKKLPMRNCGAEGCRVEKRQSRGILAAEPGDRAVLPAILYERHAFSRLTARRYDHASGPVMARGISH